MADCIDAQITQNLIDALKTIRLNNINYNTEIVKVELSRKEDKIDAYPYLLVVPNEPDPLTDDTIRADELEFLVWYFDGGDDAGSDPFTWRLRNVQADVLKAIRIDPSRGSLAQDTTMGTWDYGLYFDANGIPLEGVYMYIKISRFLNPDDPYELGG